MNDGLFASIDWQRPWIAPFRELAAPIVAASDWRAELNQRASLMALRNHRGLPIRFVPQSSLPPDMAYEAYISATGSVPTRGNLHDFFNALMWLSFPRIKAQLNALQAAEIQRAACMPGRSGVRGAVRDAATIFDENAALMVMRDRTWLEKLRAHRWSDVFVTRRSEFARDCEVHLFGHALMEKLIMPYKAITAHTWSIVADAEFFTLPPLEKRLWLDAEASRQLESGLMTADFTPLPVLGVPSWCDGQDEQFYTDAAVFRPKRRTDDSVGNCAEDRSNSSKNNVAAE